MLVEKEETGSTNDDAAALAAQGAPAGMAVLAARQTRGRGRAGRAFASPGGGLYLSVVLRPTRAPDEWSLLPLFAGLAVVEELRSRGFDAALKWPNDVLLAGGKVAGILVESTWGRAPYAIVGVGLNLAVAPVAGSTALSAHGEAPARRELAEAILARLLAVSRAWEEEGRAPLLARVRRSCVTLGRKVSWDEGEGVAIDIAEDGALIVDAPGGSRRVLSGDVRVMQD